MLDADELAEMRALQARAYRRDAEVTDADATRLRELEGRRVAWASTTLETRVVDAHATGVAVHPARGADDRDARFAELVEAPGEGPTTCSATHDDPDASAPDAAPRAVAPARSAARVLWRPIAIAAATALVVGIGLGWFLFGRPVDNSVALTPEQQEWQNALLAEGVYDSGSVRAIAVEEGVVVWTATKDEHKNTCLILSNGDTSRPNCQPTESVEDGLWGSLVTEISEKVRREVVASVIFAPSGEAVVRVDVMDQTPGSSAITYATEEETAIAEQLADDGYDPNSIWVAGYDGDIPIWTATEPETQAQCLIFDGSTPTSPRVCADPQTMTEQESGLVLNVVDTESGNTTTFEMSSNYGPSYLVITRERGELGAGGD